MVIRVIYVNKVSLIYKIGNKFDMKWLNNSYLFEFNISMKILSENNL